MNLLRRHLFLITALLTTAHLSCTGDKPLTAIEVTNGDCEGRILNPDGSPVSGATVKLISEDFTPDVISAGTIDSTFTDSNGIYRFDIADSCYFNIIALKASASCFRESVYLLPDTTTHIEDLTLRESGWLSGHLTMKTRSDPGQAVILIRGTDSYVTPDSDGTFQTPPLPAGTFNVRIFTSEEGYAVFDTVVVIREGEETRLQVMLATTDAPDIEGLSTELDSALMYLTLNWVPPDTSLITAYQIFVQHGDGSDTSFLISKTSRSFTDDVLLFENDTLNYAIAAIGLNYREGCRSTFPTVVPRSPVTADAIIELDYIEESPVNSTSFTVTSDGDIMLVSDRFIRRFDREGNLIAQYETSSGDSSVITSCDEAPSGVWYCVEYSYPAARHTILKLDRNLVMQQQAVCSLPEGYDPWTHVEVSRNSDVVLSTISFTGDLPVIYGGIYDSTLNFKGEFFRDVSWNCDQLSEAVRNEDTMAVVIFPEMWDESKAYNEELAFFDLEFNMLWSFTDFDLFNRYRCSYEKEKDYCDPYHCFGGPGGTVVSYMSSYVSSSTTWRLTLMIADRQERMLVRKAMHPPFEWDAPQFDRAGNVYFKECDPETGQIRIYGYTTDRLFQSR